MNLFHLILHQILSCANDPGATISNETINLKINDDSSITDNVSYNTVLKKSSSTVQEEIDICNSLKTRLDSNYLN